MTVTTLTHAQTWVDACPADALLRERGAAVLLPDGTQAALFRLFDGSLYAVGNIDPFTGAAVMSRGIVGDRGGEPTVASPMLKQVFSLRTGACLDAQGVRLPTYTVRERDTRIEIAARPDGEVT
ncbi:nitrite reductase small subunit NirD [Actinorugispora endophytica]|uniref:Nitrite reductase (NADH) small subunit n=1 Tax=Actinorugispora endophytica TaxID=1605990 RepID=A0A4V3D6J2_9ACTN|nr:nitrite reductase small subunit NirD [Actinorugispora endophytica]TDQ44187.1 nitrite reductase (NADH) small subunit [Actinorugispora endophytica]